MVSKVLVAMDDSAMAERALEFALDAYPEAAITVAHVVGVPSPFMVEVAELALADDIEDTANARAEVVFERARAIADEFGVPITTVVEIGHPSRAIVGLAPAFDVVVVGSHGRNLLSRILLGNVAERIVRRSPVPVTVVR